MRIAVNWNQRSVSSCYAPSHSPFICHAFLLAQFDFDDALARFACCRTVVHLYFRFHEFHWRNQSNMMESKQNAKLLHLHVLAKRLLFLCCLVRFRRRFSSPTCMCAASAIVCYLLMLHNAEHHSIQQQKITISIPLFPHFPISFMFEHLGRTVYIEVILAKIPFIGFSFTHFPSETHSKYA